MHRRVISSSNCRLLVWFVLCAWWSSGYLTIVGVCHVVLLIFLVGVLPFVTTTTSIRSNDARRTATQPLLHDCCCCVIVTHALSLPVVV